MNVLMGLFGGSIITAVAALIVRAFQKNAEKLETLWSSLDDRLEEFLKRKFGFGLPQIVHNINDEVAHRTIVWMSKYCFTREFVSKFIRAVQKGDFSHLDLSLDGLMAELEGINDVKDIKNASDKVRTAFNEFQEKEVVAIVSAEAAKNGQPLEPAKAVELVRANVLAAKTITNEPDVPATKEDIINHMKKLAEESKARKENLQK